MKKFIKKDSRLFLILSVFMLFLFGELSVAFSSIATPNFNIAFSIGTILNFLFCVVLIITCYRRGIMSKVNQWFNSTGVQSACVGKILITEHRLTNIPYMFIIAYCRYIVKYLSKQRDSIKAQKHLLVSVYEIDNKYHATILSPENGLVYQDTNGVEIKKDTIQDKQDIYLEQAMGKVAWWFEANHKIYD